MITYDTLDEKNLEILVEMYVQYYNTYEEGCWNRNTAYKRIHPLLTVEDHLCYIQRVDNQISGFFMGYYKQFDDIKLFYIEEIVIFKEYQNQKYGTNLMKFIEEKVRENGVEHMELICVNDEHHMHFYEKLGYSSAKHLCMMGKRIRG